MTEILWTRKMLRSGEARAIREKAQISRADLAEDVPMDSSTLWRWENGRTTPKGKKAKRYGQLLRDLMERPGG